LVLVVGTIAFDGQWSNIGDIGDKMAHFSAVNWKDEKMITFGGTYPGSVPTYSNEVKAYDYDAKTWTTMETNGDLPSQRKKHIAELVFDAQAMVVFGGADFFGKLLNDVYLFTIQTQTWTKVETNGEPPLPRIDHSSVVSEDGKTLLIFGGIGKGWYNDVWALDLSSWTWTHLQTKGDIPTARSCQASAIIGNNMYVFGGLKSYGATGYLNDFVRLDLDSLVWTNETPAINPAPRSKPTLVALDNSLLLFGGRTVNLFLNDICQFDLQTKEWRELQLDGELPKARNAHGGVLRNDVLVVFGGYNDHIAINGNGYLNQLAEFHFI